MAVMSKKVIKTPPHASRPLASCDATCKLNLYLLELRLAVNNIMSYRGDCTSDDDLYESCSGPNSMADEQLINDASCLPSGHARKRKHVETQEESSYKKSRSPVDSNASTKSKENEKSTTSALIHPQVASVRQLKSDSNNLASHKSKSHSHNSGPRAAQYSRPVSV